MVTHTWVYKRLPKAFHISGHSTDTIVTNMWAICSYWVERDNCRQNALSRGICTKWIQTHDPLHYESESTNHYITVLAWNYSMVDFTWVLDLSSSTFRWCLWSSSCFSRVHSASLAWLVWANLSSAPLWFFSRWRNCSFFALNSLSKWATYVNTKTIRNNPILPLSSTVCKIL